jgi:hypothetical protein
MAHSPFFSLRAALAGAVSILAAQGCDVTIKNGDVSFDQLHGRAVQEWNRKYEVADGGRVEIVNVNGPVTVVVGAPRAVEVTAVLTARAMTDERAKEVLSRSSIDESASPEHIRVAIVRDSRGRGPGRLQVSYTVTAPPDARVEITTNNGTLKAEGLSGPIKAMVVNGEIELTGLRGSVDAASVNGGVSVRMAEVTARVRLESTNGRVALELPNDSSATLTARSVNGGISVTGLNTPEASGRRIRNLESVLNGGGPEIDLRVTNGRITITGSPASKLESPRSR